MKSARFGGIVTTIFVFFFLIVQPGYALTLSRGDMWCDSSGNLTQFPDTSNPKVYTALGCVPAEMNEFVVWLLPYLFGIAGGISFLLMVYGFIQMTLSSGDPKAVQGAKETITSAITGLLVSIFALFLLRLIAVNILHIPGIL